MNMKSTNAIVCELVEMLDSFRACDDIGDFNEKRLIYFQNRIIHFQRQNDLTNQGCVNLSVSEVLNDIRQFAASARK